MAAEVTLSPTASRALLNYYLTPENGGVTDVYPGTAGDKLREYNVQPAVVQDMRVSGESFTLDKHGFQLVQHSTQEEIVDDTGNAKDEVYPATISLLKDVTGATNVIPLSHVIRRDPWNESVEAARALNPGAVMNKLNPTMFCHVDQSYNGAVQLLNNLPDAARLAKNRWGIVNVWRPVQRTILREPLAVCDWNSIKESDLWPVTGHPPTKGPTPYGTKAAGYEMWNVASNPEHKWYYAPQMTTKEALLIKCFDSRKDRARLTPHTAFQSEFDTGPARQSIEIRCLVFWEDQSAE